MPAAACCPHCAELLEVVLPCVADREESIRVKANHADTALAALVESALDGDDRQQALAVLPALFAALTTSLQRAENATRQTALMWLYMLLQRNPDQVQPTFPTLFPELMKLLGDPSDQVVELDIRVLAMITNTPETFEEFLTKLVELLQKDNYKLMHRAGMLVKSLANESDADVAFRTLASILCREGDLGFVSSLVTTLNMILLTAPELLPLRNILKRGLADTQARDLFTALYRCWCFNSVAAVSLCLLAKAYEQAYALIRAFGEREITVSMMVQIDKLVQLLESPVFTYIRIALLEPAENPYLVKTLFGILMLLPQSSAFEDLHKRLKSVNTLCNLNYRIEVLRTDGGAAPQLAAEWEGLLRHYQEVEDRKEAYFRSRREEQR